MPTDACASCIRLSMMIASVSTVGFLLGPTAGAQITVGQNVHVSVAQAKYPMGEVLVTADPTDPNHLLGCGIVYAEAGIRRWTAVYLSTDGGKTWSTTLETKQWEDSADPACSIGPNGVAHHVAIAWQNPKPYVLAVYRSTDGGRTWREEQPIPMKFQGIDRESLVADATGGPYTGRVYITGESSIRTMDDSRSAANGMGVWVSRDGGKAFGGPLKLLSPGTRYTLGVGNSVVLSDGTLVTLFGELKNSDGNKTEEAKPGEPNALLEVLTSKDGGESLTKAVKVDDYYMLWPPTAAGVSPTLAADPGSAAFKDRLYATWADIRSGRSEILLSYSADKGKTWSPPVRIDDDRPYAEGAKGPNDFMPTVAVNTAGVVGVTWYDRRDNPDNLGWYVRFRASLDGGETWLPSVRVSAAPNTYDKQEYLFTYAQTRGGGSGGYDGHEAPEPGPLRVSVGLQPRQFDAGDYAGLAADAGGRFHAFWIDNRTGLPQIWAAPITVQGVAAPHGGGALAALEDVSSKTTLELSHSSFDRVRNTVSLTARLKNASQDTLTGPFKARVVGLTSELAYGVAVANSANGVQGPGAVWDFSDAVRGGVLRPGEESAPKRLLFRLSDLRPLRDGNDFHTGVVTLEARILAHASTHAGKTAGGQMTSGSR